MKLFVITGALALAASLGWSLPPGKGNPQAGKTVFEASCKMCHGAQGQGNPAIARALKVAIPDLGSPEIQSKADEELIKGILQGKNKIKPVKGVSDSDTRNVVAFVRTLAKK